MIEKNEKIDLLEAYFKKFLPPKMDEDEIWKLFPSEMQQYNTIKEEIFTLMKNADNLASQIRAKIRSDIQSF